MMWGGRWRFARPQLFFAQKLVGQGVRVCGGADPSLAAAVLRRARCLQAPLLACSERGRAPRTSVSSAGLPAPPP
eukprot:14206407-Alexandrium_andersonii.AAC.1